MTAAFTVDEAKIIAMLSSKIIAIKDVLVFIIVDFIFFLAFYLYDNLRDCLLNAFRLSTI